MAKFIIANDRPKLVRLEAAACGDIELIVQDPVNGGYQIIAILTPAGKLALPSLDSASAAKLGIASDGVHIQVVDG